ncbi:zinc transporter [Stakelama pacifica]|uniref:Zinc transporter n=1 Tax=Stakelama pacifica TaxID=517720 RepID=A0A4R6FFC8_9SPHN|nr:zinc transporter [Stakelama pacifica]GGO98253.1 transporter [Stakelama pacifica]
MYLHVRIAGPVAKVKGALPPHHAARNDGAMDHPGTDSLPSTLLPDPDTGLIFARILDGNGGSRAIDWDAAARWCPTGGETLWMHLDRTVESVDDWLRDEIGISEATVEALVSNQTRPRAFREADSLIAVLRGINFNPGAEPEDMITLQIWARADRVITLRRRILQAPRDILDQLERGAGPRSAGDLVTEIVEQLVAKMGGSIVDMNERIDELEEEEDDTEVEDVLDVIATIRRNCLGLKRHMSPQHEALMQIARDPPEWMSAANSRDIRETIDQLKRYLEDIDVSKESVLVLQDDINNRAANRSNHTMYMLSIVAAIFLPLSFVTGLLGINVGGVPGVNDPQAFWKTMFLLGGVLAVQLLIFRRLRWL